MPYPGYLLNPGDMFQVEPDRVLFATGTPKPRDQNRKSRFERRTRRQTNIIRNAAEAKRAERRAAKAEKEAAEESEPSPKPPKSAPVPLGDPEVRKLRRQELMKIVRQIEDRIGDKKVRRTGKRKQEIRAMLRRAKAALIFINTKPIQELDTHIKEITQELLGMTEAEESADRKVIKKPKPESEMSPMMKQALEKAIARIRENPADPMKPYATPWQPRPYMSAFAFIPRYLEVNHNICSAVYLRHPVARPGIAECMIRWHMYDVQY
jgi:hypothetical protein